MADTDKKIIFSMRQIACLRDYQRVKYKPKAYSVLKPTKNTP